jgi:hypothetical protein
MTKVKVRIQEIKEIETDFEYPVYLYFQDEDCMDEYVKVEEKGFTRVKYSFFGLTIERGTLFQIENHYLENNLTSKERFDESLKEAIELVKGKKCINCGEISKDEICDNCDITLSRIFR